MITGFAVKSKEDKENRLFDYVGCLYPEGLINTDKNLLFNHDQINRIYAIGYSDEEEKEFKERLNKAIEEELNKE